jgi:multidrug transporter EmrE-like cation transporter
MGIPHIYWYVLLIVMMETMAMTCFKKSTDHTAWFAVGVLFYAIVGYLLRITFSMKGMAITNALWSALSVVATTTVGILLFKEALHTHDFIAIALITAGVVILKVTD